MEIDRERENKKINLLFSDINKDKVKIKFADKLIKYSNKMKENSSIYKDLYKKYLTNWNIISIIKSNHKLITLIDLLSRNDVYNIKKTIIDLITYENLDDELYSQFIYDFIYL